MSQATGEEVPAIFPLPKRRPHTDTMPSGSGHHLNLPIAISHDGLPASDSEPGTNQSAIIRKGGMYER
jgi:hypothetical protein